MTAERFHKIEQQGAWVNLSARAKWRFSGADGLRYLNGQVTNDVRKARMDEAVYACVTNAKGRMEGDVFIHSSTKGDGSLMIDAEDDLRESLGIRLGKYIVADDVEEEDVTDDWCLWHVFGAAADALAGQGIRSNRFGVPGLDFWFRGAGDKPRLDCAELPAEDLETWRVCAGVPRWPSELNGETFPPEAGIEGRAMDFAKGCYIGQEVLSRIKTTGKMPRRLTRFTVRGSRFTDDEAGDLRTWKTGVRSDDGGFKETGAVTSACLHPLLDRWVGLAYVRAGGEGADSVLLAGTETARIFAELEMP